MTSLVPRGPGAAPARLDQPQQWGVLPTLAFWRRRDVWRLVGVPAGVFVFIWSVMLDLVFAGSLPWWLSAALAALGPVLFIGLFERYVRARMLRRLALEPGAKDE